MTLRILHNGWLPRLKPNPDAEIATPEVHAALLVLIGVTTVSISAVVRAIVTTMIVVLTTMVITTVIVVLTTMVITTVIVVLTTMVVAAVLTAMPTVVAVATVTAVVTLSAMVTAVSAASGHGRRGEQAAERKGSDSNQGAEETFHRRTSLKVNFCLIEQYAQGNNSLIKQRLCQNSRVCSKLFLLQHLRDFSSL